MEFPCAAVFYTAASDGTKNMKALYKKICELEVVIAAASILITVFVIFVAALTRTVGFPINWALDIALLLFTWGVFLGADVAFRENKLVNVDILFLKLRQPLRDRVELAINCAIAVFLALMVYQGFIMSVSTWHRSFQGIPALSYTWVTLSMPICSLLMLITVSLKIHRMYSLKKR